MSKTKRWTVEDLINSKVGKSQPEEINRQLSSPTIPKTTSSAPDKNVQINLKNRMTSEEERLNNTEREWLAILRTRPHQWLGIHCLKFKLGFKCFYTPDFVTIEDDGSMVVWDSKGGHIWEDSIIKMKTLVRLYPWVRCMKPQKLNGHWKEHEVRN